MEYDSETGEILTANTLEWSVSELSGAIKRTIEDAFGLVRVRGEISGFRGAVASGHCYFSLKDASAKIDAVIWKGVVSRLRIKPEEGLEVIATGKMTTFPGKSGYQLIIDSLELAGRGALMAMLEERRKRLAAEGLFDEARKRPLPYLPRVIGVVTSPTGAVIRDILHRLEERFPVPVLVWPVRVQGETSAAEVAAGIIGFNALAEGGIIPRPDVIIVARGGGSLEDLMSFNDEAVVRAAANSDIPLVSAVGHETDWTLIDYASDLRAPTPTGAAEKVVPVRADLMGAVADLARRERLAMRRMADRRRTDLRALARALPQAESLLSTHRQRLDLAATRLPAALQRNARSHQIMLDRLAKRLTDQAPATRIARLQTRLGALVGRLATARAGLIGREQTLQARRRAGLDAAIQRLRRAVAGTILAKRREVDGTWKLAASLGPQVVLGRGYALVRDVSGDLVRLAAGIQAGTRLNVQFADAAVSVTAGEGGPTQAKAPPRKLSPSGSGSSGDQGKLF